MDSKRVIKVVFDLLLVALVVYILYSALKGKVGPAEAGMAMLNIVETILGVGLVIFFHELGHFLAAKACNVRVETFSVGFGPAIPGCEYQYGETLYKLGRFPIGGYVKMLGQVDPGEKEEDEIAAREDPRSYMNKTVGQRMLIISAGVVMNVLLGILCFAYVYMVGKEEIVGRFGVVEAGSPADRAGVVAGSRLLQVDDNQSPVYQDLLFASMLSKPGVTEIYLKWETPAGEIRETHIVPLKGPSDIKPKIGIGPPLGLQVIRGAKDEEIALFGSPAATAGFKSGDKVIAVRPQSQPEYTPLNNGWDLVRAEEKWKAEPLEYKVKRGDEEVSLKVEPAHFYVPGFCVTMGPVRTTASKYAPMSGQQFEKDDVILAVGDEQNPDPLRVPDLVQDLVAKGKDFSIKVRRNNKEIDLPIIVSELRDRGTWSESLPSNSVSAMGVPALGFSYDVYPKISRITPASPAEKAGLQVGDEITTVTLQARKDKERKPYDLAKQKWPTIFTAVQLFDFDKEVELQYTRNGQTNTATLTLQVDNTWPLWERGLALEGETTIFTADSFGQAVSMGFRETYRFIVRTYQGLKSLVTLDVSPAMMSGPVDISKMAFRAAEQGFSSFMLLMGIISVNLAVVNFLPIPILDGGHMVFLLWEKIRGRPAGERAMAIANLIGLVVILSLMAFVLFLDLGGRKWFLNN